MDLLSKRYADPCFFINGMIQTGRLPEFVDSLIDTSNKEMEEKVNWEFFLHKVFEGTYNDFINDMKTNKENQNLSADDIETTVQYSVSLLNRFNPEKRG